MVLSFPTTDPNSPALADERRQLRGTEGHVVLRLEHEPVPVEAQAQGRIERRLVGGDLDRERVRRRPGPAGGDEGMRGHAQETVEAVREAVTAPRPRSEPDRRPRLARGRAHEKRRRGGTEVERHGLEAAVVFGEVVPLPRYRLRKGRGGRPSGDAD